MNELALIGLQILFIIFRSINDLEKLKQLPIKKSKDNLVRLYDKKRKSTRMNGVDIGYFIILLGSMIGGVDNVSPLIILTLLYGFSCFLSAIISNAAVAIFFTPIGVMLATLINVDPRPFLIAICFGASCCFITPMGYQTNMMVYGPGQYRLKDFVQMGIPLTLLFWITAVYFIPRFWPFLPQ